MANITNLIKILESMQPMRNNVSVKQIAPRMISMNRKHSRKSYPIIRISQNRGNNNNNINNLNKQIRKQTKKRLSLWTFSGLNKVYEKMFERAGWMILEFYVGNRKNVQCYFNKIKSLQKSIKEKATITQNRDRITDLYAMFYNLEILHKELQKIL
jgi:hypothetical protein